MRWAQVERAGRVNEISFVQNRAAVVQVDYVVRNRTLGAELPENQISHPQI